MDTTQTPIPFIVAIVFIIFGIIILAYVIAVIKQHRYVKRLDQLRIEAEINTLETERKRIAADIHDELGPILSAAKLKFSQMENLSEHDLQLLVKGNAYIDETITKMRNIARGLMPTVLLYNGPVVAIREFVNHVATHKLLNIQFEAADLPDLTAYQSLHIYRILQEIIHNTMKHAVAANLSIIVAVSKSKLVINTADDGVGFNYKENSKITSGVGLHNIQSRVHMLNGALNVKSKIGDGTHFYITIPL